VVKNHGPLADAMGLIQRHLGRIEIVGEPEGAQVLVNGRAAGTLPLAQPVPVSAGEVDVELQAPGYERTQRTLTVAAGQYRRIVLRLAKEVAAAPAAVDTPPVPSLVTAPAPEPAVEFGRRAEISEPADAPAEGPSTGRTVMKWSAAGLAVGSLALGVAFTIVQRKNVAAFDSYKICEDHDGTAVVSGTATPMPQCQQALHDYLMDEKVAIAGFVGAGAFAITWLILQLIEPSPATRKDERALAGPLCGPWPGQLAASCGWRF